MHAAQNERLPLRVMVQVSSTAMQNVSCSNRFATSQLASITICNYSLLGLFQELALILFKSLQFHNVIETTSVAE